MDPIFEQFNTARKEIRLDVEKKKAIRNNLLRLVEADIATKPHLRARPKQSLFVYFKNASVVAMAIILLGAGTSFAAEGTLPGDILYPVKVAITEPVRTALSLNTETKANWEAELANRRLSEAVKLAQAGKLDAQTENNLSTEFEKHQEKTQEKIAEFESRGKKEVAASLAAQFEGSLKAHEDALNDTEENAPVIAAAVPINPEATSIMTMSLKVAADEVPDNSLKTRIKNALVTTADTRTRLEEKIKSDNGSSTEREADAKIETASKIIKRTQRIVKNKKDNSKDAVSTADEDQLQTSANLVAEAKTKSQAKLFGEAFNLANQALRDAQESKTSAELRASSRSRKREQKDDQNTASSTTTNTEAISVSSSMRTEDSKSGEIKTELRTQEEDSLIKQNRSER